MRVAAEPRAQPSASFSSNGRRLPWHSSQVLCVWRVPLRFAAAKVQTSIASPRRGRRTLRLACLAGMSGCLLLGCAAEQSQQDSSSSRSVKSLIPTPERALLQPQGEPGCEAKTSHLQGRQRAAQERKPESTKVANLTRDEQSVRSDGQPPPLPPAPQSNHRVGQVDPNATLGLRIRLEYERDCFRRAEVTVRDRLHRLQTAVGRTMKAVKRIERDGS
jgi:hypothetical protein